MWIRSRFLCITTALALLSSGCFLIPKEVETAKGDQQTQKAAKKEMEKAKSFSHALWNGVLKRSNKGGFVNYEALKGDRKDLDNYLALLSKYSPANKDTKDYFKTREEQLAYWMNAYNALVFQNVMNRIAPKFNVIDVQKNFFYQDRFDLGGERYNLYGLENDIVREQFKDPRIHFALNCASYSCPRLPEYAFTADKVEQQLEAETVKFVNEKRNCEIDKANGKLIISSLFNWYGYDDSKPDFFAWAKMDAVKNAKTKDEKIIAYLNHYLKKGSKIPARKAGWKIEFRNYNWKLNKQGHESGQPGVFR
jgi:hypothetical protein